MLHIAHGMNFSLTRHFLRYLEKLSCESREIQTLLQVVTTFFRLCDPVLNGRLETMTKEPDLIWMNMRAAVEVPSRLPRAAMSLDGPS